MLAIELEGLGVLFTIFILPSRSLTSGLMLSRGRGVPLPSDELLSEGDREGDLGREFLDWYAGGGVTCPPVLL